MASAKPDKPPSSPPLPDDENKDTTYVVTPPKSQAPLPPETTPSTRQTGKFDRLHDIKARVKIADPNDSRCLVTNYEDVTDIQHAHCVQRAIMESNDIMMCNIEWWWNLRKRSLHLDTRYNIIPLTASMHTLWDKRSWVLLPSVETVKRYHETLELVDASWFTDREKFVKIEDGPFEYEFIAVDLSMKRRAIHRQDEFVECPNGGHYSAHAYPFHTLPKLISHLRPQYAVLAAGLCVDFLAKKAGASRVVGAKLGELDDRLLLVWDIALAWTAQRPETAESNKKYTGELPDGQPWRSDRKTRSQTRSEGGLHTPSVRSSVHPSMAIQHYDGPSASKRARTGQ